MTDKWGLNQPDELFHSVDWDRAGRDPAYRDRVQKAFAREYPNGRPDPAAKSPKPYAHLRAADGGPYVPGTLFDAPQMSGNPKAPATAPGPDNLIDATRTSK